MKASLLLRVSVTGLCLALAVLACGDGGGDELTFTAGPLGAVELSPGDPIEIRSLNSISGEVASLGTPNQRGVELAVSDYGSVAGRAVSLQKLDDLCSSDGGRAGAQTIVADQRVLGVIGTTCSVAAVAASPLISEAGMVMIAPSNTSPVLTSDMAGTPGSSYHPGYFRTSHNDAVQGRALAHFVREELGFTRAAAIHDGDPYTESLTLAFGQAFEDLGGELTALVAVNKGDTDMTEALAEVSDTRPEALFFPLFMPEGWFVVQQVASVAGLGGVTLIVSAALLADNFMEMPESEGVYISGPDLRFGANRNRITGRTAEGLLAEYVSVYGEAPSAGYWGHAYDATTLLLRAIEEVAVEIEGTLYIDRQALRDELHRSSFDGIIGKVTCDQYGDCGTQRISVIRNTDPRNVEIGKNNVVFGFAP